MPDGGSWLACGSHFPISGSWRRRLLALALVLDSSCNLVPDEAFYWTWTRHLSTGYFDHPPMIAWIIWLSTRVLGNTELGVRLGGSVMSIGSLAVVYWLARRILHDARAVGFVILMWIAGPLLPVIGTIITPDAPATFFSVCALACAVVIAGRDDLDERAGYSGGASSAGPWLLFGIFCGLAFLSKYTTVLLPAGVGLAMVSSSQPAALPAGRGFICRQSSPWRSFLPAFTGITSINGPHSCFRSITAPAVEPPNPKASMGSDPY